MSAQSRPLRKLGFLHIVPYEREDPRAGFDEALDLFAYGEELGLDGGWIRTRHLQYGVSSAAVFLTAAGFRTSRLDLGVAVIPTGYETPLRLAEDLATADILSGGRLNIGLSVGGFFHPDEVLDRVFGAGWRDRTDLSYGRIDEVLRFVRGEPIDDREREIGVGGAAPESSSDRVEPHSPGLADRLLYGAGSLRSAEYAGRTGLGLLVSNITSAEKSHVFDVAQREQIDLFRSVHPHGDAARVVKGAVIVPTDNTTPEQRTRFEEYVAARTPRTRQPVDGRMLVARDFTGSTEQIVEALRADAGFQAADEFILELPHSFVIEDYRHIVRELATSIGPALGWSPRV